MASDLPNGWTKTSLGELTEPSRVRALPAELPDLPYVGLEHIEPHSMKLRQHGFAREVRSPSNRFAMGDVLYGKMRPYLNKVWVAEFGGLCSAEFLVFPQRNGLNSRFLALRLNAEDFVAFANGQVSGERPRVDFKKLSRFPILLPPTSEQERIVAKLTTALSAVARAEAAADRALERLKRYRTAVLDSAVTGELTRSWRKRHTPSEAGTDFMRRLSHERRTQWEEGERSQGGARKLLYVQPVVPDTSGLPEIPKLWTWASAEELTEATRPITYGVIKLGPDTKNGVPTLRSSDVRHLRIDLNGVKRISKKIADAYGRTYLKGGEVLVTVRGTLGGVASVPDICAGFNISREVAMLAPVDRKMAQVIAYFIGSDLLQRWMLSHTKGIAYTGLNIASLRELPIPIPPASEQQQIIREVERRLAAATQLASTLQQQLVRSRTARQSLLREAFEGRLVTQNPSDEPAHALVERLRTTKRRVTYQEVMPPRQSRVKESGSFIMQQASPTPEALRAAWQRIGGQVDARRLFEESGLHLDQVVQFYETIRSTPELRAAFQKAADSNRELRKVVRRPREEQPLAKGRFRLVKLWLADFKNLKDYAIDFNPTQGLDVVLGWNGTGKSNLFEALVIIFRDLHDWWERSRWPDKPMNGFSLTYEMDEQTIEVNWRPEEMKRPELKSAVQTQTTYPTILWQPIRREDLPLPRFVFGYYSGPTNRLAEHFLPMKQGHYDRLRSAKADDAETLARLLEQRRFFCAETHHAKYVLLGFSYKEDPKINEFLESRLRIVGFESALFVIRKPAWAKPGSKAEDFWGATGIMRRVMERLRRYAIAPMVLEQRVSYGYRSATEDHYYFFLPDLTSLHAFAAEYPDARTFFLALESTDFSELIHDVIIQVRVKSAHSEQVTITFHQLSEGEQQLLMVLGLMRFTKSHQSLVLLDEPDTHLNPHWSVEYLKDLARVMSDNAVESSEQQTSQILMATHDPLVIASLIKEQIHLLKRDAESQDCKAETPSVDPRGLGFTGILTSEMFGFRSDLDPETLADLDNRVRLIAKEGALNLSDKKELEAIDKRLAGAGFSRSSSDPYYAAFIRAWGKKFSDVMSGEQFLSAEKRQEIDKIASQVLEEAVAEVEKEVGH